MIEFSELVLEQVICISLQQIDKEGFGEKVERCFKLILILCSERKLKKIVQNKHS